MIVVKLNGGLGNQMFQYAYAKALKNSGFDVKLDNTVYKNYKLHGGYQLSNYKISIDLAMKEDLTLFKQNRISRVLKKLGYQNKKFIKEKSLRYDPKLLDAIDDTYIEGYFQSEKYFQHIRKDLLEDFTINKKISNYTAKIAQTIKSSPVSCSIHVRRGDFITYKNINIHGMCSIEYYKKAMNYMQHRLQDITYIIFSDEIEWVKSNLILDNAIYIESSENRLPHEDIYLMSLCNHNIIANSSFSWWGAWLNRHKNKIVIAPERWFADKTLALQSKDIVCANWIKV